MAAKSFPDDAVLRTDKVVIVTGPTFGSAVGFILLGAAIGAGAVLALRDRVTAPVPTPAADSAESKQLLARLSALTNRVRSVARKAGSTVGTAAQVAAPIVSQAVVEGRAAARETERDLRRDLERAADEPEKV